MFVKEHCIPFHSETTWSAWQHGLSSVARSFARCHR